MSAEPQFGCLLHMHYNIVFNYVNMYYFIHAAVSLRVSRIF